MALYVVTRPFSSDRPHTKDEIVDLAGPHVAKLVEQRFLKPLAAQDAVNASVAAPAPAPVVQASPASETPPAPVKRGRGRPRKNPLPIPAADTPPVQ